MQRSFCSFEKNRCPTLLFIKFYRMGYNPKNNLFYAYKSSLSQMEQMQRGICLVLGPVMCKQKPDLNRCIRSGCAKIGFYADIQTILGTVCMAWYSIIRGGSQDTAYPGL